MKKTIFIIFLLNTILLSNTTHLIKSNKFYKYDNLFKKAELKYGVPFVLLKAIALTESSFKEKAMCNNTNKTKDVGLMQINTIWKKTYKIKEKDLILPENNIDIAAKILSSLIKNKGYSWDTIGRYHSSTSKYKKIWLSKVKKNMKYIINNDIKYKYKIVVMK